MDLSALPYTRQEACVSVRASVSKKTRHEGN